MRSLVGSIVDKAPIPLASPAGRVAAMGGGGSRNDAVGQMEAFGRIGTLFGIVDRLATGVSKVEWHLYRRKGRNPGKGERTLVDDKHAAFTLWQSPNPFAARQEFVEAYQQHQDLTGEGWWVIGRASGINLPLELWLIRPDRIAPVPHPTEFISGYVYRGPAGELIPLGLDEVIMLKRPNPLNPYRGIGPVQSIMPVLDSRRYSIEWNRNFFINSAEPGGFVVFKKTLTDKEFQSWQERWREQHKGVAAAHRVGILENAEWQERKFTQRDMQFAELTNVTGDMIREAFGIHKATLGLADDVNRANADAAKWLLADDLLVPRLDRIKGALNHKLLPLFDADPLLEFDYDDPRPDDAEQDNADRDSAVAAAVALIGQGADWDETLAAFGLPAIPRSAAPEPTPEAVEAWLGERIAAAYERRGRQPAPPAG